MTRGRPSRNDEERKPLVPVKISEQLCWKCEAPLKEGAPAIAHRYGPVAWCVSCAGRLEPERSDLVKAIVGKPL